MRFERHFENVYDPDEPTRIIQYKNVCPPYKYEADSVNKLIDSLECKPVAMQGLREDIHDLKKALDNIIGTNEYFYLSYGLNDIAYHWDVNEPGAKEAIHNMWNIVQGIEDNMRRVYAYVLAGLGEHL